MSETVPERNFLVLTAPFPMTCLECGEVSEDFLVANEVIFGEEELGIDAVVRYSMCEHTVHDVVADPLAVAMLTEFFESTAEDEDGGT